mgnify:CR=1 FL=1
MKYVVIGLAIFVIGGCASEPWVRLSAENDEDRFIRLARIIHDASLKGKSGAW